MRITLSSGRQLRLIFSRAPHPTTKKAARRHRWTQVIIAEDQPDRSDILSMALVRAYPPDIFTREAGRQAALAKALDHADEMGTLSRQEQHEVWDGYFNRPRPRTTPPGAAKGARSD